MNIFKTVCNAIIERRNERNKQKELDKIIKEVCSDKYEYEHRPAYGTIIFEELTPFLRPCPKCGKNVKLEYHNEMYVNHYNRYAIKCYDTNGCHLSEKMKLNVCPDVCFYRLSEKDRERYMREIITKWNTQNN